MNVKLIGFISAISLTLTGCAALELASEPTATGPASTKIQVVAATNVWGDVAESIGGDAIEVFSIIDSVSQDPHSYEASARDQLAVSKADLLIANGGGYDDFLDVLAKAADKTKIIYAVAEEDKTDEEHNHDHGNEHVWYDFHVVANFAERLSEQLTEIDPNNEDLFEENLILFLDGIEQLEDTSSEIAGKYSDAGVVSSEPVADYLLLDLDLDNQTPESFSDAIEEELDVPPAAMLQVTNLLKTGNVALLVVNEQTGSKQVDLLIEVAQANDVKIVYVSELLPPEMKYFDWMSENLFQIEAALR